jgi:hypothetical protein
MGVAYLGDTLIIEIQLSRRLRNARNVELTAWHHLHYKPRHERTVSIFIDGSLRRWLYCKVPPAFKALSFMKRLQGQVAARVEDSDSYWGQLEVQTTSPEEY